ncbi:MAG: serine/threonine protein kinase [Hungatella sp.]|nr:serine/threonine protein kinase [Hungatella sp.]
MPVFGILCVSPGGFLGAGGFGITYAAWDFTLEQPVAIKEYFPQMLADRDVWESNDIFTDEDNKTVYTLGMQRFSREARVFSTLQNIKNVVTVFDWFEANETAYIIMEYVRGKTIDSYVQENHIRPRELFAMFHGLIDSLASIHAQGILHRDISPSNIMVEEDGGLKIIDFGASVVEQRRREGLDQKVIYNHSFAPIEQYSEKGEQGARTDIYALSATLYYFLTGELPQESVVRSKKDSVKSLHSYRLGLKKWQERAIMEGIPVPCTCTSTGWT